MTTTARRWTADAALAALVLGVELAASLAAPHWHGAKESRPGTFGIILLVTGGLALLARRRYPGTLLAVCWRHPRERCAGRTRWLPSLRDYDSSS